MSSASSGKRTAGKWAGRRRLDRCEAHGFGCQNQWYHFGVGAPPILKPILVGIGMFTGGTIWILTHGHMETTRPGVLAGFGSFGGWQRRPALEDLKVACKLYKGNYVLGSPGWLRKAINKPPIETSPYIYIYIYALPNTHTTHITKGSLLVACPFL